MTMCRRLACKCHQSYTDCSALFAAARYVDVPDGEYEVKGVSMCKEITGVPDYDQASSEVIMAAH